jgi:hypothetical protein
VMGPWSCGRTESQGRGQSSYSEHQRCPCLFGEATTRLRRDLEPLTPVDTSTADLSARRDPRCCKAKWRGSYFRKPPNPRSHHRRNCWWTGPRLGNQPRAVAHLRAAGRSCFVVDPNPSYLNWMLRERENHVWTFPWRMHAEASSPPRYGWRLRFAPSGRRRLGAKQEVKGVSGP